MVTLIGTAPAASYDATGSSIIYKSPTSTNYGGTGSTLDEIVYPITSYVRDDKTATAANDSLTWRIESTNTLYTTTAVADSTPTTYYLDGNTYTVRGNGVWAPQSAKERKKAKIKQQLHTAPSLRGRPSFTDSLDPAEVKALQLLKSLVSPENFRRYLKYGFVIVEGMSGLIYNVYRRRNTVVFDGDVRVASLCVHLKGNQPPTDEVIAKVLMCECDEQAIWKRSNHSFRNKTAKVVQLGFDRKAA